METKTMLICNADDTTLIESSPYPTIYDENSYEKLSLNNEIKDFDRFIIVAELNWASKNFSDFHGLELIKKLRVTSKSKASILVTSHYPYDKINADLFKHAPGSIRFLRDTGVNFVQKLDIESKGLENVEDSFTPPLDDSLLEYLNKNLYNDSGYLMIELNALHDALLELEEEIISYKVLEKFFNKLTNLFTGFEKEIIAIKTQLYTSIESFPEINKEEIFNRIQEVKGQLEKVFSKNQQNFHIPEPSFNKTHFGKVLYVDNNEKFGKKIRNRLLQERIDCTLAFDVNEAIEILKADDKNEITLLICDYKFLNERNQFDRMQAFHLSKELAKMPNLLNMVVLTGLNPYSVNNIITQFGRMVEPIVKSDIFCSENGLNRFSEVVKKLSQDAFNKIGNCVAFKNAKTHKLLYKIHRESRDYQIIENDITEFARYSVKEIVKNGMIPKRLLPNLSGRLENKNTDKDLDNFRQILLGRRLVLGLCQIPYKTLFGFEDDISKYVKLDKKDWWYLMYNAIKNGELKLNYEGIEDTELHNVINRNLRMSIKQNYNWQAGKGFAITIEEKKWLNKYSKEFANLRPPE